MVPAYISRLKQKHVQEALINAPFVEVVVDNVSLQEANRFREEYYKKIGNVVTTFDGDKVKTTYWFTCKTLKVSFLTPRGSTQYNKDEDREAYQRDLNRLFAEKEEAERQIEMQQRLKDRAGMINHYGDDCWVDYNI